MQIFAYPSSQNYDGDEAFLESGFNYYNNPYSGNSQKKDDYNYDNYNYKEDYEDNDYYTKEYDSISLIK
ncbi:unnamed protein product, partial [Heterobilharzia americana]